MKPITVLMISGSLRRRSSNTAVLRAAAALAPEGVSCITYEGIGSLPHFNPEWTEDEQPESVREYRRQLAAADALLICTPEYANGVPGVLKNALDLVVGTGELWHKPVASISASPMETGGQNAHHSLRLTLSIMDTTLSDATMLSIGHVSKKTDAEGRVTDQRTLDALRALMAGLVQLAEASRAAKS